MKLPMIPAILGLSIAAILCASAPSAMGQTVIIQTPSTTFPIKITKPGSYILRSNLAVPAHFSGIEIDTGLVTLDLNGFAIFGPGASVDAAVCGVIGGVRTNVTVVNGVIRSIGCPVSLGSFADIERLHADFNAIGILAGSSSRIVGNTATNTTSEAGIICQTGCFISGNTVSGNKGGGILAGKGALILANTVNGNALNGVSAGPGSTVLDNTVGSNTGFGLGLGTNSGSGRNVMQTNTKGCSDASSSPVSMGDNVCNGVKF